MRRVGLLVVLVPSAGCLAGFSVEVESEAGESDGLGSEARAIPTGGGVHHDAALGGVAP